MKLKNQVAITTKNDASTGTDDLTPPHPDLDMKLMNSYMMNNIIVIDPAANPNQVLTFPQQQIVYLQFVQIPKAIYEELQAENNNLRQQLLIMQQGDKTLYT